MTTQAPEILTMRKPKTGRVLLPYQEVWRRDTSRTKIWEKSRRIGATYTEANDAVMSRLTGRNVDYWFSSADESAAYEFAEYCRFWSRVANATADYFTDEVEDSTTKKNATAFVVKLPNGRRITAMSSSPRRFRSKGGDVCLDEFDYHDDPKGMYDAASPTATLGDAIRVMSTYNGDSGEFSKFCQMGHRFARGEAKRGDMPWSVHRVTILEAAEQGLVEQVIHPKGVMMTREEFIAECRARCRSEDQWRQEYLAIPSTDSSAWLPYTMIEACEEDLAGDPSRFGDGPRYLGADIGEVNNPSTIWYGEMVGDVLWVRERIRFVMRETPLHVVEDAVVSRLRHPKTVRGCIDATGVGTQIGQAAERTFRGEGIKFTLPNKDLVASPLRGIFEDRKIRIPDDRVVREDLHSVRMSLVAGHPRYDAPDTDAGHGDEFWACGLLCHAAFQHHQVGGMLTW